MPGPARIAVALVAAGALAGSVVLSLLRLLHPDSFWFVLITSYVPYALVGYPVAALVLVLVRRGTPAGLRRWVTGGIVLALAGTAFHAALLLPAYVGAHPHGRPDLVVLNLNLRLGRADAAAVVRLVRSEHVGLAALEEVTPAERQRLLAAGLDRVLPYSAGAPGDGSAGTMVFSTYPLSSATRLPTEHDSYQVSVGAPRPFWFVAVHASQPLVAPGGWRGDWSVLHQVLPGLRGAVVVAGDFNTTLDHGPMRELLGDGFGDAARVANSGWQPTWPSSGPGLIAIDHVLTRSGYRAISTQAVVVHGSDHRALVARLGLS
ncbi:MAG: endonuclease/exonuclease/phosphatase family protein [Marmoricola sp.]